MTLGASEFGTILALCFFVRVVADVSQWTLHS